MRPPFPGMDPWLEDPELWPDVHNSLIVSIRDAIVPLVRPRYFAGVDSRTTVLSGSDQDHIYRPDVKIRTADIKTPDQPGRLAVAEPANTGSYHVVMPMPDDEIEEAFLTIKELPSRQLVTVLEVLSPTNKKTKRARREYLDKRRELLGSGVNFVEIDLLRSGQTMPPQKAELTSDYRILIFRPRLGRGVHLYGFSYREEIPRIPIPLLPEDPEPSLNLNDILHSAYDRAGYDLAIDYRQPPRPRLREEDQAWAESIIAQATLRSPEAPAGGETPP
ncbi:MAG: DUF4058 family protein [Isosphaeraceae bacterium]